MRAASAAPLTCIHDPRYLAPNRAFGNPAHKLFTKCHFCVSAHCRGAPAIRGQCWLILKNSEREQPHGSAAIFFALGGDEVPHQEAEQADDVL
jgi:hypothetical protein